MSDLVMVVPSRGRPHVLPDLIGAFAATCTADIELVIALDDTDPSAEVYGMAVFAPLPDNIVVCTAVNTTSSMVEALNREATTHAGLKKPPAAIGFMGDDHRPRTRGWDTAYLNALREMGTGIVYGDDLLQHHRLPTQCAMSTDIVQTLGYMAPPTLSHLFVDNVWKDWGQAADCLRYLPDVVIEHMHPLAAKAAWDPGHRRVNSQDQQQRDKQAYRAYKASQLATDVEKIRGCR